MPTLPNIFKNIPELELDKTKKRILLIYGLALLVILILYFRFFLKPSLAGLFNLIPKARTLRMEIRSVRNDLLFEDELKKKQQMLLEKLDDYEKRLSREKELPMLLENLSKMAKSSRVKISGITPLGKGFKSRKDKKKSVYQEVPILISAQSGYHELGTFINRLENDPRYMQISDIKIKSNKANPKRHDVEFVVYAYTFKRGE